MSATTEQVNRKAVYLAVGLALIAVVGSVVTAIIASNSNSANTERQIKHDEGQKRQNAVGAARVLAYQFVTAEVYMQGGLDTGVLMPYDPKYDVQISQEDLKAISSSSEIGVDRWQRISASLSNLDSLGFFVRHERSKGVRHLHKGARVVFQWQIATIDNALDALAPLAGTPKIRQDPFGAG
jgi:hypothetical protein